MITRYPRRKGTFNAPSALFFVLSGMCLYAGGSALVQLAEPTRAAIFYIGFLFCFGIGWSWRNY